MKNAKFDQAFRNFKKVSQNLKNPNKSRSRHPAQDDATASSEDVVAKAAELLVAELEEAAESDPDLQATVNDLKSDGADALTLDVDSAG